MSEIDLQFVNLPVHWSSERVVRMLTCKLAEETELVNVFVA
jgi:hypothetical protein